MATTFSNKPGSQGHESSDTRTLLLTQKTELIGELAQAMANQFNNIMMAVTSYAELELKKAKRTERHGLEQVITHANRATSLIQKLLSFSRKHTSSPQPLELDAVIADSSSLLNELLGEHAEVVLTLDSSSEIIQADRVDMEQTLFALVLIARNAMEDSCQMTISTSTVEINQEFIGTDSAEPGKYVVLAVETSASVNAKRGDSGNLDQSQRVNLSLAAVRGIVRDCHGLARFSSEPGASSSFKVYFPASVKKVADDKNRTLPRNPAVARTILIVEDDDSVRVPASEFLMMEGFKVLQARTGTEALNVVKQSRSSLDILVTDIFMPKMNGHEVASALLEEHPDLKVLYISGDPGRTFPAGSKVSAQMALRKPFRLNTLRDKIHDLLGE
jgi:two-component system, cell cycle sensor histidine kinase and response regulator CckA